MREGIVGPILDKIGVNRQQLERTIQAELGHFPKISGGPGRTVSPSSCSRCSMRPNGCRGR